VLHRIRDVRFATIQAGPRERTVEEAARRPDEGMPRTILLIAGCSPTNMIVAVRLPSPNTVCVPTFQR
jgi:hypothetical protein